MKILGKPHKITGIEKSPVYRAAYRACVSAGRNDAKRVAKEYGKIVQYGLDNPTKTKIILQTAKRDYQCDIVALSNNNAEQIAIRQLNTFKTNIKLKFNLAYRKSQKAINDALKFQHPESYKLRKKLLESGNITLENNTRPFARLGRLNINPFNL